MGAGLLGAVATGAPFVKGSLKPSPATFEREMPAATQGAEAAAPTMARTAEAVAPEAMAAQAPEPLPAPQLNAQAKIAAEGGMGSGRAREVLAQQAMPNPKTVDAAKRLGIEDYLQPDHVTTNQAFREFAQAVKSIPGSQARAAEIDGLVKVGERADRLIVEMGGHTDLSRLSENVKGRISGTVDQLAEEADKAYKNIETKIPKQTRGEANNVLDFINQRAQDMDGVENLSSLEKEISKKLTPRIGENGQVVRPTYALIDSVRRDVGAAAKAKGPFADADTGLAKQLYKLIDEDQFKVAEGSGLGSDYRAAKELVKLRKGFEDDLVSIYGKHLDESLVGKLGTATTSLSKGDADKLAKIMKSIPEDMRQEVAASALNTAFGKATQNGSLNFSSFSQWYEGLLANKQAHAALMVNLGPAERKSISDLYRVAKNISMAARERITTGRIQAVREDLAGADSLIGNVYGAAKRIAIGVPLEAATSSVGLHGVGIASAVTSALTRGKSNVMRLADDLITSPEFMKLAKESATKPQVPRSSVNALVNGGAFRRFAKTIQLPQDPEQRTRWVMNALRAENSTIQ
jgi:hypothetical protein